MICFQVAVNGERLCTAGIGDDGVLNAIISWVGPDDKGCEAAASEAIDLHVGGLANDVHVRWLNGFHLLKVGDVVAVAIIDRTSADAPLHEEPAAARAARNGEPDPRACNFCGRSIANDRDLVPGPSAQICRECVGVCNDLLSRS